MSRYQKGKTNVDFGEARDSEWQWHQLGHMQVEVYETVCHLALPWIGKNHPVTSFQRRMIPVCLHEICFSGKSLIFLPPDVIF